MLKLVWEGVRGGYQVETKRRDPQGTWHLQAATDPLLFKEPLANLPMEKAEKKGGGTPFLQSWVDDNHKGEYEAKYPPASDPRLNVDQGQLTFDAEILENPGGAHHSRVGHWPGGNSGVTSGRGYDIGQKGSKRKVIRDMTAAGLSEAEAKVMAEAQGKQGGSAKRHLRKNKGRMPELSQGRAHGIHRPMYALLLPVFAADLTLTPADGTLTVELVFTATSKRSLLTVPTEYGMLADLDARITFLEVEGATAKGSGRRRKLKHAPGTQVVVEYAVQGVADESFGSGEAYYGGKFDAERGFVLASTGLVLPWFEGTADHSVRYVLPEGSEGADGWGRGPEHTFQATYAQLVSGQFAWSGEVDSFSAGGGRSAVVWVGDRPSDADDFVAGLQRIERDHRAYWSDDAAYDSLVVMVDVGTPVNQGGTGGHHAFTLFGYGEGDDARRVQHTLAHEQFHRWLGGRIRGGPPEGSLYWVTEGFTEYAARRWALDSGTIDLQAYADEINDVWHRYRESPVRDVPNATIVRKFWQSYAIEKQPYLRGELLALTWNAELVSKGGSIDSFIQGLADLEGPITRDAVEESASSILGRPVGPDLDAMLAGATMVPPKNALGPCYEKGLVTRDIWSVGLDVDASAAGSKVTGVVPGGPADRAGLKDGQPIGGLSVYPGRLDKLAVVTRPDGSKVSIDPRVPSEVEGFVHIEGCSSTGDSSPTR